MSKYDFPKLYKHSVAERLDFLKNKDVIDSHTSAKLLNGENLLKVDQADKMIENVVGVLGLPIGLGLNFLVNGKEYVVPMVVEEPSIVAAVSSAAKTIRKAGGFSAKSSEMLLIGQIAIDNIVDPIRAGQAILESKEQILNLANSLHPKMVARGGGAVDVEVKSQPLTRLNTELVVIHLLVDTKDAMGANLVNSMCEGVAALIEKITGGDVFLKILSNFCDRSVIRASVSVAPRLLTGKGYSGEEVRDRIVLAGEFAANDPYRAATHNKGIMNGVDAVAIATGNDWRAIEAAAHVYASGDTGYQSLSTWSVDSQDNLVGRLEMPLKVGIVGGSLQSNPAVKDLLAVLNVQSARELAEVMGAVGLAQNFAALRALVTEGIQQGHMTLHARSVAVAAGVRPDQTDIIVEKLIESGEIKIWKAKELVAELDSKSTKASLNAEDRRVSAANGKIILFGEHAVVYGRHALALPIPQAIEARITEGNDGVQLVVPRWGIDTHWTPNVQHRLSIYRAIDRILEMLGLTQPAIRIVLSPQIPRAVGLGSSAAAAVAMIRALSNYFQLNLDDWKINQIAYESEKIVHGMPSGIDNHVATYAKPIMYKGENPPVVRDIDLPDRLPLVIGYHHKESLTAKMVASVSEGWLAKTVQYENWFDEIDQLTLKAWKAIQDYDLERLGELMNKNQKLLRALKVTSSEQNEMIRISLDGGAIGAKMTGGGGGGAVIALCPQKEEAVTSALKTAGYETLTPFIEPGKQGNKSSKSTHPTTLTKSTDEQLIVVDENDEVLGFMPRSQCHAGEGILHRAFSIHIFNDQNQILLQQRSEQKQLWPLYWSNGCCSHPRVSETTIDAAQRRLREELRISVPLQYLFKFKYQARFANEGAENELCSVYIGRSNGPVIIDESEIASSRFVDIRTLESELTDHPERFTPWFKIQWQQLRRKLDFDAADLGLA